MSDIVLWENQEFVGPFSEGLVASAPINNNNLDKGCRVFATFSALDPSPCSCDLRLFLEKEVAPNVWEVLAAQNEPLNSNDNAPDRHLVLSPLININQGFDEFVPNSRGGLRISRTEGVAGKDMRLSVYKAETSTSNPLQRFTITAYASLFNLN